MFVCLDCSWFQTEKQMLNLQRTMSVDSKIQFNLRDGRMSTSLFIQKVVKGEQHLSSKAFGPPWLGVFHRFGHDKLQYPVLSGIITSQNSGSSHCPRNMKECNKMFCSLLFCEWIAASTFNTLMSRKMIPKIRRHDQQKWSAARS